MCASKEDVLYARRRMRFTGEPTGQAAPRHAAQIAELLYRGALDAGRVRCAEGEGDLPAFEYGGVIGGGDGGQVEGGEGAVGEGRTGDGGDVEGKGEE